MSYTVKQLSSLSGVSVRTLHWYDEIGLLPPAFYGDNGYRYYEEEQLLLLQQILFFRELGIKLDRIQSILTKTGFDKIRALKAHKHTLEQNVQRTKKLIQTIEQTIEHLKGETAMKEQEFYNGFDPVKQKEYEEYLVNYYGTVAEDLIFESQQRTVDYGTEEWKQVEQEGNAIYKATADLMDKGFTPKSEEVQKQIALHFAFLGQFYTVTKDVYVGLSQLYCEHPDFKKFFTKHHPDLAAFFAEAMRVYARDKL